MIVFKATKGNGGFGDRLIGLVSCIFLSELLNEELFIDWSSPDIANYIAYNSLKENTLPNIRLFDMEEKIKYIERLPDIKNHFSNKSIESNLNFIGSVFVNKNIDSSLYEKRILDIYRCLFKKHLIPKTRLLKTIDKNCAQFRGRTIGIQIRMGDAYMGVGSYRGLFLDNIDKIFQSIREHQYFDSLFITSDNQKVIDRAYVYFNDKNIIYDDQPIKHTDRMETSDAEVLKVLSDIITLSKTDFRYISLGSNFGRVGNLISNEPSSYTVISNNGLIDINLPELITVKKDRQISE